MGDYNRVITITVWLRGASVIKLPLSRNEADLLVQALRRSDLPTRNKTRISQSIYGAILINGKMRRGALVSWIKGFMAGRGIYGQA